MMLRDLVNTLEREVATLKGRPVSAPSEKPTNPVAYRFAFDAWLHGDRKAMKEYLKHYRNRPLSTPQRTASMLRGRKANQPLDATAGRAGADPGRPLKGGSDVEGTQNPHGLEGRRHLEAQGEGECNRGANLRLCGPDDGPAHTPRRAGGYGRFGAYLRPHLLEVGPWRGTL